MYDCFAGLGDLLVHFAVAHAIVVGAAATHAQRAVAQVAVVVLDLRASWSTRYYQRAEAEAEGEALRLMLREKLRLRLRLREKLGLIMSCPERTRTHERARTRTNMNAHASARTHTQRHRPLAPAHGTILFTTVPRR